MKMMKGNEVVMDEQRIDEIFKIIGKDDDKKVEYIKNSFWSPDIRFEIAQTLKTDEAKMEVANLVGKYESELIQSLESDEMKIKYIKGYYSDDEIDLISSLKSDDYKMTFLEKIEEIEDKTRIIQSMQDDDKKIEVLDKLEDDKHKKEVIDGFQDDDKKIEALDKLEKDFYKKNVIINFQDEDKKVEALDKLTDDDYKLAVILTLEGDDKKIELIDVLEDELCKVDLIHELEDNDKKIETLDKLQNEEYKAILISEMDEDCKIDLLEKLSNEKYKAIVISSLKDDNKKMELLNLIENVDNKATIIQSLHDKESLIENLEKIGVRQEKLNILKNLYKKNEEVLDEINFEILDDKYIDTLGEDKVNLISNYIEQNDVLELSEKEFELFHRCIDYFTQKNNTDEWTTFARQFLCYIEEYDDLINSIENFDNVDIDRLTKIIQNENEFDLKSLDDVENFETIKRKKCDEKFYSSDILEKRHITFLKIFGHDGTFASSILNYFKNVDKLKDEGLKDYVKCLKIIENADENLLEKIYTGTEEFEFLVDQTALKRDFKTEYCKLYNDGLFNPEEDRVATKEELNNLEEGLGEELEGFNVYNAGADFRMIVTSVGAFSNIVQDNNYKENWNMLSLGTQQFCASMIRNDMIATAPRKGCCYGFSKMKDDSLILAGPKDLASTKEEFVPRARGFRNEIYYAPDELINNTEKYNEIDFRRIQGGEKKQPDYIIALKLEGKIENLDEIKRAYADWEGKLPICIVDIDECLRQEAIEVAKMQEEMESTKDEIEKEKLSQEISQKIHNNQVTINNNFSEKKYFLDMVEEVRQNENAIEENRSIGEQELQENYEKVSIQDKNNVMKQLKSKLTEITNEKGEER